VQPGPSTAPPKSLLARFIGIITEPKETFESVVAHPKFFGMLAVACVLTAVLTGGFMLTKVGQDAWVDAALASQPGMSDQQVAGLERMAPYVGYGTIAGILVIWPIFLVIIAGILFAVFNAALGGNASFKQIFAVVVHTAPVGVIGQLVTVPLNYARGSMTSATNLGMLTHAFVPETSLVGRFLGAVDLFLLWQLFVLAIGLAVLYRRKTQPIAITFFGLYAVIALIIAFVRRGAGA
jgi:hypothetical protein